MTLNQRRILYIFFIISFLIITPLVSFYATGYSIGKGLRIEKTGILIIDSEPRGAKIYLNSKVQQTFFKKYFSSDQSYIKTPAKIKNLLPGEYEISLELNNYWPWQKKLNIKGGESTYAEDIFLFKKDLPIRLKNGAYDKILISPNEKNLVAFNNNEAIFISLTSEKINTYQTSDKDFNIASSSNISWSPNEESLIFSQFIFNTNNWSNPTILSSIIGKQSNIRWGNNNEIFYATNNGLYRYNIEQKINKTVIKSSGINDFLIKNNLIYYIEQSDHATELNVLSLGDNNIIKKVIMPYSSYVFLNPEHVLINLYDKSYNILYLIDPFSDIRPLRETINNVNKTFWLNDNKLLFANNYEIWTFDLTNYRRELLTRISDKINKIIWHPNNNYVIYSTDNTINTLELDDREKHIITNIIKLDTISELNVNQAGDTLYFYSRIGNQEGIYKLLIQ